MGWAVVKGVVVQLNGMGGMTEENTTTAGV